MLNAKPNAPFVVAIISTSALLALLAAASISSRRTSVASSPDDVAKKLWNCSTQFADRKSELASSNFTGVDFYLAGWAKTGTNTLAAGLQNHPNVVMIPDESWYWWLPKKVNVDGWFDIIRVDSFFSFILL